MATYRAIKGLEIQVQSSDPSNPSKGQIWYNSTAGVLKIAGAGAWSSGGSLNVAAYRGVSSNAGTQTACINFGGTTPLSPTSALNEEYDGTTWTEVGDMNTGRYNLMSAGTSTSCVAFGGKTPPTTAATEEWGGSSWVSNPSPSGDLGGGRYTSGAFGTLTAALCTAGDGTGGAGGYPTITEEYNGTTWSEVNDLPGSRYQISGAGTQTAGIVAGGQAVPGHSKSTTCFEYDGTSWAAGNAMGTGAAYNSMFGIQTDAKLCGNSPAATLVQDYDGTSWATGTAMTTARFRESSAGTVIAGIVIGGGSPAITTVEEFSDPGTTTITTST